MKPRLYWSSYEDAGLGDAYADIPRQGGDFAKAVAVCINSRRCEADGRGVMCPSYWVSGNPDLSTGGVSSYSWYYKPLCHSARNCTDSGCKSAFRTWFNNRSLSLFSTPLSTR